MVDPATLHHQVNPLGRAEQGGGAGVLHLAEPVTPGPGRVHHDPGPDEAPSPAEPVLHLRAHDAAGGPLQADDRHVVGHQRAVLDRRPRRGQGQPGVVALRVVEERTAPESALTQHRLGLEQRALAQHAVPLHIAEQRQEIVEPHAGREPRRAYPVAAVERKDERQGPDQMGRDPEQHPALPVGLEHQAEVAGLQVAQAAVHQSAGA